MFVGRFRDGSIAFAEAHVPRSLDGLVVGEVDLAGPRVVGDRVEPLFGDAMTRPCPRARHRHAARPFDDEPALGLRIALEAHALLPDSASRVTRVHRGARDADASRAGHRDGRGPGGDAVGDRVGAALGRRPRIVRRHRAAAALLHDVRELVREQRPSARGVRRVRALTEDDVRTHGVRAGIEDASRLRS